MFKKDKFFFTAHMGMPVSTTHVISGSIFGVGSAKNWRHVNWGTARTMVLAWLLTIPISAALGAGVFSLVRMLRLA